MVFSSATFLFVFLPVTILLYYLVGVALTENVTVKNLILLIASLVFYAWGEPVYIVLMLISICFNFFIGKDISLSRRYGKLSRARAFLIFAVIFNIGVLGFFKYADFVVMNLAKLPGIVVKPLNLPLPIGISFYTFQILSYIIDVYNGRTAAQKKLLNFALYVALFPQLIAGPIVKYKDIAEQLENRRESMDAYGKGFKRFVIGLAKKLILANTLGSVYATVQASGSGNISTLTAWVGILCYTLQIYFDFSGYSDMAIGLGGMFGFEFNENFNYPYIAYSITEFWKRWHISLSSWFKDYVYIPLGGNRCKVPRVIFNLMVVWILTGLWHGAAWNFVFWGLYYGVLLILEKYVFDKLLKAVPKILRWLVTMVIVMVGWVFFSAPSLTDALTYIGAMFGRSTGLSDAEGIYLLLTNAILILFGVICSMPVRMALAGIFNEKKHGKITVVTTPLLLIICIIFMISESYNPFLYFRF